MSPTTAMILYYLSWGLLVCGGLLLIVGAIGILRFPDLYTRIHPAGLIDTGGASLILCGLMLQSGWSLVTVKLLLILFFLLFTGPTATHALARAALAGGLRPWIASADKIDMDDMDRGQ